MAGAGVLAAMGPGGAARGWGCCGHLGGTPPVPSCPHRGMNDSQMATGLVAPSWRRKNLSILAGSAVLKAGFASCSWCWASRGRGQGSRLPARAPMDMEVMDGSDKTWLAGGSCDIACTYCCQHGRIIPVFSFGLGSPDCIL